MSENKEVKMVFGKLKESGALVVVALIAIGCFRTRDSACGKWHLGEFRNRIVVLSRAYVSFRDGHHFVAFTTKFPGHANWEITKKPWQARVAEMATGKIMKP